MKRIVITLAILGAAVAAQADYAANTFGPGQSFDPFNGYTIAGSGSLVGSYNSVDDPFTAAASGTLTNITVAAQYVAGTNSITATLYNDNGGAPGTALESWTSGPLPAFGSSGPVTVFTNVDPTVKLTLGQNYWLSLTPGGNDTWAAWNLDPTDTTPAFSAQVTPEPASFLVLGFGVVPLLRRKRS